MMNRRSLLKLGLGTAASAVSVAALGDDRVCKPGKTPAQTKGPFYPIVDQVDTDGDLIRVAGANQIAKGTIVIVEGVLTDQNCNVVKGALVEVWQACHTGKYNHPSDPNTAELDPNFQYWGKAVTDEKGFYRFRTIIPGAYPAAPGWIRPPHIHFKVSKLGYMELITQMYFAGDSLNAKDEILKRLTPEQRKQVTVNFSPVEGVPHSVGVFNIQIEKI